MLLLNCSVYNGKKPKFIKEQKVSDIEQDTIIGRFFQKLL